ncbi:MAG: LysE family translocator [Pseudoruegeria sp.]
MTLSLSGLAVIAQSIPIIFTTIKWAGATYLAWLAWKAWHASVEISQVKLQETGRSPLTRMLAGFAVTLGNPKAMLFYMALLPNLVQATEFSLLKVLPYYLAVGAVVAVLGSVFAVYLPAAQTARTAMKRLLGYRQSFRSLRSAKATLSSIETIRRGHIYHKQPGVQGEVQLIYQLFAAA